MDNPSPIRPTDAEARSLAQSLIAAARFGALGTLDPDGSPQVTRIALGHGTDGALYTLVSGLAAHTRALATTPRAGLLLGEPLPKGDPLTHPRLSLTVQAEPAPEHSRAAWLAEHPKSKLYIDLPDFRLLRLRLLKGALNGGFGRAFLLTAEDLADPQ